MGGLDWRREVRGLISSGLLRSFADLCVGCTISDLNEWLLIRTENKKSKLAYTVAEIMSYMLSITIAWKWSDIANAEFLIVISLIVGLIITFSNTSYTTNLNKEMFSYLGTISLPLYICHYSIGYLIGRYLFDINIVIKYVLYFSFTFFFSVFMLAVNKTFQKRYWHEFCR